MDLTRVLLKDKTQPNIYKLNVDNGQYYISYFNPSQFYRDEGYNKSFKITIDGVVYDNSNITSDGLTFKQSLYSTDILDFSCVEKGELSFDLINFRQDVKALNGSRFKLEHFIGGILTITEYYTIYDIYKKNDNLVTIKAYDDLVLFDKDVTTWFNSLKPNNTFTEVYNGLLTQVGYTDKTLPSGINGNLLCKGSIKQNEVKGYQVLGWLQERVQGFFKPVRGELKLKFIRLNATKPVESYTPNDIKNVYISDYRVKPITKAQIRATDKDIGGISGTGTNTYIIQANPFYSGMTSGELTQASTELLENVMNITYTPFKGTFLGLPNLEVGDLIQVTTRKKTVATAYLNKRTLKIRQMIVDDIECQGKEKREEIKLVNKHLEILRQRTLEIEATVDRFQTKMTKIEEENGQIKKEMSTITQTSNQIKTDVQTVKSDLSKAQSTITQNSENIKLEVAKTSVNNYFNGLCINANTYNLSPTVSINGKTFKPLSVSYRTDVIAYSITLKASVVADYIDEWRKITGPNLVGFYATSKTLETNMYEEFHAINHSIQFFCKEYSYNWSQWLSCNGNKSFVKTKVISRWIMNDGIGSTLVNIHQDPTPNKTNYVFKANLKPSKTISHITSPDLGVVLHDFANVDTAKLRTMPDLHIYLNDLCLLIDEPDQKAGFYTSTLNRSVISEINMSPSAIKIKAKNIDLQGYVTVSDLSGKGKTTIDGSNIKTGTISADRLDLSNIVTVGKLSQSGGTVINGNNITTGTISADRLDLSNTLKVGALAQSGGTTINADNITTGTINATKINAPTLTNLSSINGVHINQHKADITVANWDGQLVRLFYNNGIITGWQTTYDPADGYVPAQCLVYRQSDTGQLMLGCTTRYSNGVEHNAPAGQFFSVGYRMNGMVLASDQLFNGYPYKV